MRWTKNPYEGNKRIQEDEASYEDHHTVLLINLIVDLIVTATLAQAKSSENPPVQKENNHSI